MDTTIASETSTTDRYDAFAKAGVSTEDIVIIAIYFGFCVLVGVWVSPFSVKVIPNIFGLMANKITISQSK